VKVSLEQRRADDADLQALHVGGRADRALGVGEFAVAVFAPGQRLGAGLVETI
jgi:hypothetical protein